ncbi:hypothetical protein C8J57DRAFT_1587317 [Mycena rebaudengoi]|nr:hypothetical protein C8J57DRAFT_1587317 [Mycena rebaudengoi]
MLLLLCALPTPLTIHASPVLPCTGDNYDPKDTTFSGHPRGFFSSPPPLLPPPRRSASHTRVPTPSPSRPRPISAATAPPPSLSTPDSRDALSTAASHRQTRATHSPRPTRAVSLVLSTMKRSPRLTTRSPRLTAHIHAGEPSSLLSFFLSVSSRAPPRLLPPNRRRVRTCCVLRPPTRSGLSPPRRTHSRSRSTARSRARRLESPGCAPSPPKKQQVIFTHRTEKSTRQHVKARNGVPESVTQGKSATPTFFEAHSALARTSTRPRSGITPPRVGLEHTRRVFGLRSRPRIGEQCVPDPPRVARAQSLRTLRTFDSLHASPARGVVVACTVRGLRTRSQRTERDACTQLVPSRVARAAQRARGFYHLKYML